MCIVIDTNTLSMVFDERNSRHNEFSCIKRWIDERSGYVVFGGTKYKTEIAGTRFGNLIRKLRDSGQAIRIRDEAVDTLESDVIRKTNGKRCNDQHIIALLGASRCPLLCSGDRRSFEFVKNRKLYPKQAPAVKIYTSKRNIRLLSKTDPSRLSNVDN